MESASATCERIAEEMLLSHALETSFTVTLDPECRNAIARTLKALGCTVIEDERSNVLKIEQHQAAARSFDRLEPNHRWAEPRPADTRHPAQ